MRGKYISLAGTCGEGVSKKNRPFWTVRSANYNRLQRSAMAIVGLANSDFHIAVISHFLLVRGLASIVICEWKRSVHVLPTHPNCNQSTVSPLLVSCMHLLGVDRHSISPTPRSGTLDHVDEPHFGFRRRSRLLSNHDALVTMPTLCACRP